MQFNSVVFDVDSTLVTIEGLAEIARKKGVYDEVLAVTNSGMDGDIPFTQSLTARLNLVHPDKQDIEWLGEQYIQNITPGAEEVVTILHNRGVDVYLVSGAYTTAIQVLAEFLDIPVDRAFGINLAFDETGAYTGICPEQILSEEGGKKNLLVSLELMRHIAFVGDGVTDLETAEYVDRFIGFGGVVERESVKARSPFYTNAPNLQAVLEWL